jgi:hypothetical protein
MRRLHLMAMIDVAGKVIVWRFKKMNIRGLVKFVI